MDVITREYLKNLSHESGHYLVSIYLPTHRVGREMQQDPIRLKNLLTEARERLESRGLRNPEIEKLLRPAESLILAPHFWQHQSDGLAIFMTPKSMKSFRLPINFKQLLVITERFHLKPLLPLLYRNGHFYVLALSQNQVRLLEGTLFSVDEVDLGDMPTSLREALWFDDPERQLQFHTGTVTPGSGGARPGVFHGQGIGNEAKTDLLRYFQQIDDCLTEMLGDEQAPLVLAGVDYLLPIYRQANHYPYLVGEAILGNPDELSAENLHRCAWKIIEPIFNTNQHHALARYQELSGSGSELASDKLESIVPAAHYGRVDTLFVALDQQLWGSFDASKKILEQHQEFCSGDQDILDLAAVQTLMNGGSVYALELSNMPDKARLAAIFRYTFD
jgi:hypothetical protein